MARLTETLSRTLLANDWFAGLPERARQEIIELSILRRTTEGERLYEHDRESPGWFAVLQGAVRLSARLSDGRQALLEFLEPGTWFGDTSLFDGQPCEHDAVSHGDACVLELPAACFSDLLERTPTLYRNFVQLYCRRSRRMLFALEAWSTLSVDERLALHLLGLAQAHGARTDGGVAIELHLPQEQLAQLMGVPRQRIGQLLREWEHRGWLRVRYGRVVLDSRWMAEEGEIACRLAPHLRPLGAVSKFAEAG